MLMRLVADSQGRVQVDLDGRATGRGAWVQPDLALLRRIEANPGPLKRSLRRKRLHADGLVVAARRAVGERVERELRLCWRSGLLRTGAASLDLVTDTDLILRSRTRPPLVESRGPSHRLHLDAQELGQLLGRGPRSIVILRQGRPARRLRRWLQWQAGLGYDDA